MRYVDEYFEKIRENRYLTLVPTNESKEKNKKYKELLIKIRDSIRLVTKKSDNCYEKSMKIKLDSAYILRLNKAIEIRIFYENNRYYPQVF